jgi:hypothetical protein
MYAYLLIFVFNILVFFHPLIGLETRLDPSKESYLENLIEKLESNENVIFTKFGDGEYNCMTGDSGANCDGDKYHQWLGASLKNSLIELSKKHNAYIGRWHTENVWRYCDQLAQKHSIEIPWTNYHLIFNTTSTFKHDYMYRLVKFIVNSNKKKVLICNGRNSRLKAFFKADVLITIPSSSWSFEYSHYKNIVEKEAQKDCIILIAGGLCSKVLINDITHLYDLTFIDIGSGFDMLGGQHPTRTYQEEYTYQDIINYYKELIPADW